jgi:SAM-dependent methyltransferase
MGSAMALEFTAHNIRLPDGSTTRPQDQWTIDQSPVLHAVLRTLGIVFPQGLSGVSVIDVGCLEGGYAAEFARRGMDATGLEVRNSNYQCCLHVQRALELPNLSYVLDDANNIGRHGPFDVVFCNGLLYHLDKPCSFLREAGEVCRRVIFLQTHFTVEDESEAIKIHSLSPLTTHEGLRGRWYPEYDQLTHEELDQKRWTSWANKKSFWVLKGDLLESVRRAGFDIVLEQYDSFGDISQELSIGFYKTNDRSLFVGIKTATR